MKFNPKEYKYVGLEEIFKRRDKKQPLLTEHDFQQKRKNLVFK